MENTDRPNVTYVTTFASSDDDSAASASESVQEKFNDWSTRNSGKYSYLGSCSCLSSREYTTERKGYSGTEYNFVLTVFYTAQNELD